jgi:hypothetical protein
MSTPIFADDIDDLMYNMLQQLHSQVVTIITFPVEYLLRAYPSSRLYIEHDEYSSTFIIDTYYPSCVTVNKTESGEEYRDMIYYDLNALSKQDISDLYRCLTLLYGEPIIYKDALNDYYYIWDELLELFFVSLPVLPDNTLLFYHSKIH